MLRNETIKKLKTELFDVIVVGGGINGVGVARDAALRGLKVALIEKEDFGSGTSSTSAKLIHGGLRYLETYQFKIVLESVKERNIQLKIAPHIVKPIDFIIPTYKTDRVKKWLILTGLYVYDLFSKFKRPWHKNLNRKEILELVPWLKKEGLVGGGMYRDAITDDARLCLINVQAAQENGAIVLNYIQAEDIKQEEDKWIVYAKDNLTEEKMEIKGRTVVSVAGVWTKKLLEKEERMPKVLASLGSHLVYPQKFKQFGVAYSYQSRKGGGFIIPWKNITLVGTTDNVYKSNYDDISTPKEDIEFLHKEAQRLTENASFFSKDQIQATFAGVRPLFLDKRAMEKEITDVSREYKIIELEKGFIVVIGGKLTTYRLLAKKVVDKLTKKHLKIKKKCLTHEVKLPGSDVDNYQEEEQRILKELEKHGLDSVCSEHLVNTYGTKTYLIIKLIEEKPSLKERISSNKPIIKAEIDYMLANEFVETLQDIMIRRTWLNLEADHGLDCLDYISSRLREHYEGIYPKEKANEMIEKQIRNYKEYIEKIEKSIALARS
ncbi:MAG: glycerol-3-phosphate dehydrogenase [Candidatus Heimdallarchaeaceae archaeon]